MRFLKRLNLKVCLLICIVCVAAQLLVYHRYGPSVSNSFSQWSRTLSGKLFTTQTTRGFGDMGAPVQIPAALQGESQASFTKHQFNLVASNLIGLSRALPDYRNERCVNITLSDRLAALKTSVIIVFHNEAWSTLLRTVNSVIERTPRPLLHEIILVDDASTETFLESALDHYVSGLPVPTHVERMGIRSGLVKSRLRGASISTGKTLTFLDAHCEATTGWLEPLLLQIAEDHRRVACPIIDVISETTFEYITGSDSIWGTFDWGMSFHWTPIANRERARTHKDPNIPVKTPVMAGGLFTISRDYFYEIGSYDEGMIVWGGENVEMSVRLWQCGGELLIVPCSRVGHVFRKVSPYVWPGGVQHVLSVNSLRTVLVWLDEFKDFYLKSNPDSSSTDYGDLSARVALRKHLRCKNFRWYLQNVFLDSPFPLDFESIGEVVHESTGFCLDTLNQKVNHPVGLSVCHHSGSGQVFAWTSKGELQSSVGCVDGSGGRDSELTFKKCTRLTEGPQLFKFENQRLIHLSTGLCLHVTTTKGVSHVTLAPCSNGADFNWRLPARDILDQLEKP